MKKHIIYYILSTLLLTFLLSCKKDFLDRSPQTSILLDKFFKSEQDLSLYVNGLLSIPGNWTYTGDQGTDDKATTGNVETKNILYGTVSSQTIKDDGKDKDKDNDGWGWGRLRDINFLLQNLANVNVSSEVKNHYAGLAKMYRALFYIAKVKRYSDVPWYSESLTFSDRDALMKKRDPRTMVVDSIMRDLEFASANVREKVPSGTPGKWVAKLIYSRIALYEGTYRRYHPELSLQGTANTFLQKAADVAAEVMASGKFQIYTTGKAESDYASLFSSADLSGNKEVLLANAYDRDLGFTTTLNNGYILDYELSPSRDLLQTYLMADGTRFTDQTGYQTFQFVQEFQNRDPRLKQTFFYPGYTRAGSDAPYIQRLNKNFTGYHQLKGTINTTDQKVFENTDFPAYRYAEVLLNFAEARAELGSLTQGDLDNSVNLLRSRAGMPAMNLAVVNGNIDAVYAAKYPDVSGANKGVILEIRRERRVEMACEGYRFDDLMRWRAGKLLEAIPEGIYFPGLGKYDLTGDGVADIKLVGKDEKTPPDVAAEKNSAGVNLVYYKAGAWGENVTVFLKNATAGGTIVTDTRARIFISPLYYYRPIPFTQMTLNPNLGPQPFGWE